MSVTAIVSSSTLASWMFGALLFTACAAVAAWCAEQVLRMTHRTRRWPWVIAIVAATCGPLLAPWVLPPREVPAASVTMVSSPIATPVLAERSAAPLFTLDHALIALWAFVSIALMMRVAVAVFALVRVQRLAVTRELDGERVLIDERIGPAVIGVFAPRIVVPEWLLDMDTPLRAMVMRHEREHCDARDPALVWLAVLATTLMPWNLTLWWMSRRMRSAMEVDCDARTLQSVVDRDRYIKLLLLIAQRHSVTRFMPALSPTAAQLEQRIAAMYRKNERFQSVRVIASTIVAIGAVVVGCSQRVISNMTSPTPVRSAGTGSTAQVAAAAEPASSTDHLASLRSDSPGPRYPAALVASKLSGHVRLQFIVNADGRVDAPSVKMLQASVSGASGNTDPDAFSEAVRSSIPLLRYNPAVVNGKAVRQLVQADFEFSNATSEASITSRMPPVVQRARPAVGSNASAPPATVGKDANGKELPYFDFQVEKPATLKNGTTGPKYPAELRDAKIEGRVLMQFVVDTLGNVDAASIKVLKSDHALFSAATILSLKDMHFDPARVGGKAVKQLVQTPFEFSVNR